MRKTMTNKSLGINVTDAGIAATLNQHLLMVPPNQRSYAWEESHVQTLFEDLSVALSNNNQTYFLGAVVLTQGSEDRLEVADGQQRLATTSILIAAIRDYLETLGPSEQKAAEKYTSEYLLIYDEMSSEHTPKLQMNYEDNDFFLGHILISAKDAIRPKFESVVPSHERLYRAVQLAKGHVEKIIAQFSKPADKAKALYNWIKFLRESAIVIAIRVPDHINAYTMFETLNDRGLRASQTDILKNFLFGKAQDRLKEIQTKWSSMVATIETVGDEDLLLTYLRHHWTLSHGYTPERELASLVKNEVTGRAQAMSMATSLDDYAGDYAGLLGPLEYMGWSSIDKQTRAQIYIISRILAIEQIQPLLLAVLRKFEPAQAKLATRIFLDWSVRFLVAGSGGGGPLDRAYGQLSKDVMDGSVKSVSDLKRRVSAGILRTDAEFKQAFSKGRVSKTNLARYYLRALELCRKGERHPELGGILDDTIHFNVEHIMPQSASKDWKIPEQTAFQFQKRLGNMVLLNPEVNVKIGGSGFSEKKKVFAKSPLLLTQAIAKFAKWGPAEIDERQETLADLAVKIWPAPK
jgi:Protein of unknown function DUF262/Protein of unknown function (DUF1524)